MQGDRARHRGGIRGRRADLRPSLLMGGELVPLTYGKHGYPDKALRIAAEIRAFLGHADGDIVEDSLVELAKRFEHFEGASSSRS